MDDYVMHMTRVSLLDQHLEENPLNAKVKRVVISRMMYAARAVKETDKERMTSYHQDMLQKIAGKLENRVSGFLLIYPTCCVHLIEAETVVLMQVLKYLQLDTRVIDSLCLLSFTEDVPYRSFSSWMTAFINSSNLGPYDPYPNNTLLTAVSDFNVNMLKWGRQLSEMDEKQRLVSLDSVRTAAEELLPDDPGVINGIILAQDSPKLKDVLELYDQPLDDMIFDAELVWPKPKTPFTLTPPTVYFTAPTTQA